MIIFLLLLAAFCVAVFALVKSRGQDVTMWIWSLLLLAVLLGRGVGLFISGGNLTF